MKYVFFIVLILSTFALEALFRDTMQGIARLWNKHENGLLFGLCLGGSGAGYLYQVKIKPQYRAGQVERDEISWTALTRHEILWIIQKSDACAVKMVTDILEYKPGTERFARDEHLYTVLTQKQKVNKLLDQHRKKAAQDIRSGIVPSTRHIFWCGWHL